MEEKGSTVIFKVTDKGIFFMPCEFRPYFPFLYCRTFWAFHSSPECFRMVSCIPTSFVINSGVISP
ncbi:hypothetical protein D4R89_10470 [bacterium]|nr:MAG: hypothetical protein D4R89_10470 [bacterium]